MARKGITYDQVANAARAIKARGAEPTIAAVRMECGDEGSFTTISAHIAKWRAEEADKVDTKALPTEVEDAMMTAMMQVWNVANKLANNDLLAMKQEFADEKKKLQSALVEAGEEIKTLEIAMNGEEARADKHKAANETLTTINTAIQAELTAVKSAYKQLIDALPKKPNDSKPALKQPAKKQTDKTGADTKSVLTQVKAA